MSTSTALSFALRLEPNYLLCYAYKQGQGSRSTFAVSVKLYYLIGLAEYIYDFTSIKHHDYIFRGNSCRTQTYISLIGRKEPSTMSNVISRVFKMDNFLVFLCCFIFVYNVSSFLKPKHTIPPSHSVITNAFRSSDQVRVEKNIIYKSEMKRASCAST